MELKKNISQEMRERVQTTLDQLITLNRDTVEGYEKAATLLEDEQYQHICTEKAQERNQFVDDLIRMASTYEGYPTDVQSAAGLLHEAWMSVVSMVTGDDGAILAECNRGEEAAVNAYQEAIQQELPDDVMELVRTQFGLVNGAHKHIKRLSDALAQ